MRKPILKTDIDTLFDGFYKQTKGYQKWRLEQFNKLLPILGTTKEDFWKDKKNKTAPDLLICGEDLEIVEHLSKLNLFKIVFNPSMKGTKKYILTWQELNRISLKNIPLDLPF